MNSSLKSKINEDIVSALKSGSSDITLTLRFLMSVVKNNELIKRNKLSKESAPPAGGRRTEEDLIKLSELTDEEIIKVILSEIKKRKESIAQYEAGGRGELAKKEAAEIEILKKYVPLEMPEDELRLVIKKKISEMGPPGGEADKITMKEFGKIMSSVMAEIKGRAGGDAIKKIIEEELKQ